MVEFQIDHTAFSHTRIRAKDVPQTSESAAIRRLDPENPKHIEIARTLDIVSPEVLNPYTGDHTPMTDQELKKWLAEEVYVISPRGSEEPVGYVYLYTDEQTRLEHIRKTMQTIPQEARIAEFNFWAHEDADPELVESGLRQALSNFFDEDVSIPEGKPASTPPRYAIMYVEKEDVMDAKLLENVGGRHIGDISYSTPGSTEGSMDMVYLVDALHFKPAARKSTPSPVSVQ